MSDKPADEQPQTTSEAEAQEALSLPLPEGDRLSLPEVVQVIEHHKGVKIAADETERPRFLKALHDGAFPAPIEPKGPLPRSKKGGDVSWTECYWARKDVDAWLGGKQDVKDWEESWASHKIRKRRDLPALASYTARRIVRGPQEWEHWSDKYRWQAYIGPFLAWLIWLGIVGYFAFGILLPLDDPLIQYTEEGEPELVNPDTLFEYRHPETGELRWALRKEDRDVWYQDYAYYAAHLVFHQPPADLEPVVDADPEHFEEDGKIDPDWLLTYRTEDGERKPQPARELQYREDDSEHVVGRTRDGERQALPSSMVDQNRVAAEYLYGQRQYSFFRFVAADLSEATGIPFLSVPMVLFILIAMIPFLLSLLRFFYSILSYAYSLTDQRLIVREGVIVVRQRQIRVIQIQDLAVEQGPIQRLLSIGDVLTIAPDDTDTPKYLIRGVRHPLAVKDRIFAVSEEAKSNKTYYVEAGARAGRR